MKSVQKRSFSDPYFPTFGMNTKRYGVSLHIQSECGKIRTRKTPYLEAFHAVRNKPMSIFQKVLALYVSNVFVGACRSQIFFKIVFRKNFAIFTGKQLFWSIFCFLFFVEYLWRLLLFFKFFHLN